MSGSGTTPGSGGSGSGEKEKDSHWYFSSEQLTNSPSRRQGIDADTELSYRQMAAYLIQEMGQRLQVSQLCINTAIVYMHRFYIFHSFTHFHRNNIAAASFFLAAKVEEQPRKLEHVIKAANKCLNQPTSSTTDAYYIEQAQELVFNENVLLQTLGFDVAIDHPHTHVVKTCHLVKACKDLAQTSYFLASNSLHLTSMCLQYKPTVVACFCIYLACKWSRWEIPQSMEGKHWFHYVDKSVTMDLLKQLTDEFIAIYEKSPSRLKSKLNSIKALAQNANRVINKDKKGQHEEWKMGDMMKMYAHDGSSTNAGGNSFATSSIGIDPPQQSSSSALLPPPPPQTQLSRKNDLHSSQHRSHHSSSSQHSKINFPSADVLDNKNSHKIQQFSGVVGRQRDSTQSSQGHQQSMIPGNSSRSSLSATGGRSYSNMPGSNMPRQSTQGHQMDVNYHKSRDKNNPMSSYPHASTGQQPHSGHKVAQKQDSSRMMQKEQAKMAEAAKNANNNKLFPNTPSLANMPLYGNNASQSQSKIDMGQDLSRSLMHGQQRSGYTVNNGSGGMPLIGSYPSQHARQSSSSSNSVSNSNKHDMSKTTSVHVQQHQQQQQQHGKSQSIPSETLFATDSQQSTAHSQSVRPATGYLNVRPAESSNSEDNNSSQQTSSHGALQQQAANASQSKSSLFSPDWSDKMQQQQQQQLPQQHLPGSNYASNVSAGAGESYNFKLPSSKEGERERIEALKKERNRGGHAGMDLTAPLNMGARANTNQTQYHQQQLAQHHSLKINMPKKMEPGVVGDLTGMSTAVKRPNEAVYKQEGEPNKVRKLDSQSSSSSSHSDTKPTETSKLQIVNGIETDPDLVRNLLKESLCTTSALLKTEQLVTPSLQPPAELFEPTATSVSTMPPPPQPASDTMLAPSTTLLSGNQPTPMDTADSLSGKAEKKKKKDKHKHKEKDKSKDREERKKHKKDKDKRKERDRGGELSSTEHVKIKISKDKIEGPGESLKIKIPKDRIISDVNSASGGTSADVGGSNMYPAPALKIKISKDKLEHYATEPSQQTNALAQPTTGFYTTFMTPNNATTGSISHSSSGNSGSGKKKDRDKDREREKERKRAGNEIVKSNGSGGGGGGSFQPTVTLQGGPSGPLLSHLPPTTTAITTTAAPPKSQNPNKMQLLSNNMNQLFGESNDDDDDDYDDHNFADNISGKHKNVKDYHRNRVQNTDHFTTPSSNNNSAAGSMRKVADYGSKYTQHHTMQR